MLQDAVYDIAFLSMSHEDFSKHVHLSGLLSAEEMLSVYGQIGGIELPGVKWKRRKEKRFVKIARFLSTNVQNPTTDVWGYGTGKPDCLSFSVNRKALFHGVRLFGDREGGQYKVVLKLDESELVNGRFTAKTDKDNIPGFNVMLSSPVVVEKDNTVKISATISGAPSCYGQKAITEVESGVLSVRFYKTYGMDTNGTNLSLNGQFYEIFISDAES